MAACRYGTPRGCGGLARRCDASRRRYCRRRHLRPRGDRADARGARAGKIVALANKETIVCAGELVMREVQRAGHRLRPVDSEHSALWQCLETARPGAEPERIILTASGGPFRTATTEQLRAMTAADALKHPTWNMGSKITIDSATLMNKGLEMIEARWLFDMPYEKIDVVVHPQSIVHSYIAYADGSLIAQLGPADMRLPIQYALSYPERWPNPFRRVDLPTVGHLDFAEPDTARFPSLLLARQAGEAGNTYPTVLSAADEVAVERFLRGEIGFLDIPALVSRTLDAHTPDGPLTLESIQRRGSLGTRIRACSGSVGFPACVSSLPRRLESLRYRRSQRIGLNGVGARIVLRIQQEQVAVLLGFRTHPLPFRVAAEGAPLRVVIGQTVEAEEIIEGWLIRADFHRPETDRRDAMLGEDADGVIVEPPVDARECPPILGAIDALLEDARRAVRVLELERIGRIGRRGEQRGVDAGNEAGASRGRAGLASLRHASLRRKSPDAAGADWRRRRRASS